MPLEIPGKNPDPTHYSNTEWYRDLYWKGEEYDLRYTIFAALGFDHVCTYYFAMNYCGDHLLADWINKKKVYAETPEGINGIF